MRFAYADPPYIGQAKKHYKNEALCAEVNHKILINYLDCSYDGWALSCSSSSLPYLLSLCPKGIRVASWVKPFCAFKPNVNPGYTWEPVIFKGSVKRERYEDTIKDHLICNITLRKGLAGAKPVAFCKWIIDLLNVKENDTLDDIFPGTGIMKAVRHNQFMNLERQVSLFNTSS
tara:strand:+ start:507 stop:1028 length:522 start_codon:yes stop_codon:yes gene_type:complete